MSAEEMELMRVAAIRVGDGTAEQIVDTVVGETTVRLYLNDEFLGELVASPEHLTELGAGHVICEGLACTIETVRARDHEIRITAPRLTRGGWVLGSGGGQRSKAKPSQVTARLTIQSPDVHRFIKEIEADAWKRTGAVHCSVLFLDGRLVVRRCDIGRHNSVDKVVGFAALNGIDLSRCVIACSGRQPEGMVAKAANAGIPIVVSKAATTREGIATAQEAGVTLICFARGGRFTVYTHPQRVQGIPTTAGCPRELAMD